MKNYRFLVAAIALVFLASPVRSASAQTGITLSNGAISSPVNGLESAIYSELVIESSFDRKSGTYLLNGQVTKTRSSGNFSGTYDPATQQITGEYFITLTPVFEEKLSEQYTLSGTFSGLIENSGSVTLLLAGTIKYDKWNAETDIQGNPLYKDNLEATETSSDSRQATFTVTGAASQGGIPKNNSGEENIPAAEPAGEACHPQPRGLDPSKPGEVISPGASYVDDSGKDVGIIQERWFLNGVNTSSMIWDGQPVQVELQYTCLDHSGSSITYSIPAYLEQPASLPPDPQAPGSSQPAKLGGPGLLGIAAIIGGILSGLAAIGVAVGYAIHTRTKASAPPVPPVRVPLPPANSTPARAVPQPGEVTPADVTPPSHSETSSRSNARPEPSEPSQAQPRQLTPEEKMRLSNIRDEMQAEIDQIKNRWRQARDAAENLKTIKKKNMIKFLIKKGFDVNEWVMNSPAEVINKVVGDPAMEKIFEKHDTSQDGNIIVQINNRIQSLQAEMQQMRDEVRYLQTEINKINRTLAEIRG